MSDALHLYTREGNFYVPTQHAVGPWHPALLHGGAATGLMGHAIEEWVPEGFFVTRIAMDLMRPVPKAALATEAKFVRDGARLKLIEVELSHNGKPVCRASASLARAQAITLPDYAPRPQAAPPGPENLPSFSIQGMLDAKGLAIPRGLHTLVEVRSAQHWEERGRNTSWLRLPLDIAPGTPMTPFTRACTLCDLGNGVAQLNLGDASGMINSDVMLTLFRLPVGEWLCFESETQVQATTGTGVVHTTLFDTQGAIGWVLQSVMVNREFAG